MKVQFITALIMHAFRHNNMPFDYLEGPAINGYEMLVDLNSGSRIAVIEVDDNAASRIDLRPELNQYKPHIAVLSGITRDQTNALPEYGDFYEQVSVFVSAIMPGGSLIYYANDPEAVRIATESRADIRKVPYDIHGYLVNKTGCYAVTINRMVRVGFSGEKDMQNLSAAREVCLASGLTEDQFYASVDSFRKR